MVFEKFLKKNVQVRQLDGFIKYGFLEKIEEGFLFLKFDDGRIVAINEKFVSGVAEK